MRKNKQYAVDIMYNYGTDNTIQISEFVKNYKEKGKVKSKCEKN